MAWDKTKPADGADLDAEPVRLNFEALDDFLHGVVSSSKAAIRLATITTPVGNVTTGEDDLMSYTLPAGRLDEDDKVIRVRAWGTMANNGNAKTLRPYFGATAVQSVSLTVSTTRWNLEMTVVRTGAATQAAHARTEHGSAAANTVAQDVASPTETLSGAVVIKLTGEATATNDIVQSGMIVELA